MKSGSTQSIVGGRSKFLALRSRLLDLPRRQKRALLVVLDFLLLSGVLWSLLSLRYGEVFWPSSQGNLALVLAAPIITIVTFAYANLYRLVTRYLDTRGHTRIFAYVALSVLIWSLMIFLSGQVGVPRSVVVAYGFISATLVIVSRQIIGWFFRSALSDSPASQSNADRIPVVIYGAGQPGVELARALGRLRTHYIVGFCDASPTLWGQYVNGVRVHRPDRLASLISGENVKEVLLAVESSERKLHRKILSELGDLSVEVKVVPSVEDIAAGRIRVTDLRSLDVDDLLGRDIVQPIGDLLSRSIRDKNVLVTGAGGSIGSELVRQMSRLDPSTIVLFEVSELALYQIDLELRDAFAKLPTDTRRPDIVPVLGSVLDAALVSDVVQKHAIQTIYHAAAYKHVPIVEENPSVGLDNNVFGTDIVADAAVMHGVERMVLISTDKAVRPTNVMGASKRLAELALQARASEKSPTLFTMVRFGNVLDSSGSVVGRFRQQIKAGGPVTVTHPEITRYFMSIPEAAALVIQAGAMAKGGDVFVLDMGEPVKIDELARLMIRLSGLEVRDGTNPQGDIEIVYTGLRAGEKLYEELLIGANISGTEHPRIMRSDEPALTAAELTKEFEALRAAIKTRNTETIQAVLLRTVEGYRPESEIQALRGASTGNYVRPTRTLH